jgi:hypothetical protein
VSIGPVRLLPHIGSGCVIVGVATITLLAILCLGHFVGWDATWRSLGITPLSPHFFDMHGVMQQAACATKGYDPYRVNPCYPIVPIDIPPIWLWFGHLGVDGSDAIWLAPLEIAVAFAVIVTLFKGRSIFFGALASIAILSPSIMMGVERGNVDLSILALVAGAALIFQETKVGRLCSTAAVTELAIVLKLFPVFCFALAARFTPRRIMFASAITILSSIYFLIIADYIPIIRHDAPTTFMLSYGYKVLFLGLDHLRDEAGLNPLGLGETWVPITLAAATLISAAATAALLIWPHRFFACTIADTPAGTAFCFGSGIYSGTFLLGSNFIYRLMFLLLCLPQLYEWGSGAVEEEALTRAIGRALLALVLATLWLNGDPNGHSTFLLVPQLVNWLIFFGLTTVLSLNFLGSVSSASKR